MVQADDSKSATGEQKEGGPDAGRVLDCLVTLTMFCKADPALIVPHFNTLYPYLSEVYARWCWRKKHVHRLVVWRWHFHLHVVVLANLVRSRYAFIQLCCFLCVRVICCGGPALTAFMACNPGHG